MSKIIIAAHAQLDGDEKATVVAEISYGGIYFFLFPDLVQLAKQTGQMIDPQQHAFFAGEHLDQFEDCLHAALQRAKNQPENWDQRIGRVLPVGEPMFQRTVRQDVLTLIGGILDATAVARKRGHGILVIGS